MTSLRLSRFSAPQFANTIVGNMGAPLEHTFDEQGYIFSRNGSFEGTLAERGDRMSGVYSDEWGGAVDLVAPPARDGSGDLGKENIEEIALA